MRTKFLALFLCVAVANLTQLSTALEAKDDGGYNVVYDGGSIPGLKAGAKLRVYINSNEIRIMENKTLITTLVPSTIQDISYGQDVHRRIGAAIGLAVVSFGIGGLMALTKSKKHYVGLTWATADAKGGFAMQCDKNDYRGVLTGLEGVTGKKAPKRLSTSQILREIAEDYHNMAKEGDGKADYLRTRNYLWLLKLADRIQRAKKR